jgi:hypothetical protein
LSDRSGIDPLFLQDYDKQVSAKKKLHLTCFSDISFWPKKKKKNAAQPFHKKSFEIVVNIITFEISFR